MNRFYKYFILTFALAIPLTGFTYKFSYAQDITVESSTSTLQPPLNGPLGNLKNETMGSIKLDNNIIKSNKPKYVRGIHLTAWMAGAAKGRIRIGKLLDETELNTLVIDIKEIAGEVYIPGVKSMEKESTYQFAIPEVKEYLAGLKQKGVYTIARIVVFKDNLLPRKRPDLAVKNKSGELWKDRAGLTWADPFNKEVWNYNIEIGRRAVELGFDEVQFDYIRFPSDGNIKNCVYSKPHNPAAAANALYGFLKEAHSKLKPTGANISIDVFGLTTTNNNDMGIGQKIVGMAESVDFVSPMVYPSHYNKGEYGIPEPDLEPYDTVYLSLRGAKKRLGAAKVRPYLQDFSFKSHYGAKQVREQMQAAYDNDIGEWLLWNANCRYTIEALKGKEFSDKYQKSGRPEPRYRYKTSGSAKVNVSSSTVTNSIPVISSYTVNNLTPAVSSSTVKNSTQSAPNYIINNSTPQINSSGLLEKTTH